MVPELQKGSITEEERFGFMPPAPRIDRETRERALTLARRDLARMSDEEDRAITQQAKRDPDSGWMSDEEFAAARRRRQPSDEAE